MRTAANHRLGWVYLFLQFVLACACFGAEAKVKVKLVWEKGDAIPMGGDSQVAKVLEAVAKACPQGMPELVISRDKAEKSRLTIFSIHRVDYRGRVLHVVRTVPGEWSKVTLEEAIAGFEKSWSTKLGEIERDGGGCFIDGVGCVPLVFSEKAGVMMREQDAAVLEHSFRSAKAPDQAVLKRAMELTIGSGKPP